MRGSERGRRASAAARWEAGESRYRWCRRPKAYAQRAASVRDGLRRRRYRRDSRPRACRRAPLAQAARVFAVRGRGHCGAPGSTTRDCPSRMTPDSNVPVTTVPKPFMTNARSIGQPQKSTGVGSPDAQYEVGEFCAEMIETFSGSRADREGGARCGGTYRRPTCGHCRLPDQDGPGSPSRFL